MKVKRKNKVLRHRILKRKPINHKVWKKLTIAIFITLVAAAVYSAAASHTQDAKNQRKLEQTYIQLNVSKEKLQKEINAHHLNNTQQEQQIKQLNEQLKAAQEARAARQSSAIAYAAEMPLQPSYVAPVSSYTGSGDPNLDYIIAHESSGNPYAVNSIGACGLGQSLPCSKVLSACGTLSNVDCQINWVRDYCISRYGSTYNAYIFWRNNQWY